MIPFNHGDIVRIQSPTSAVRGYLGVFIEYRKGKRRDICLVELPSGKKVQFSDFSLEKSADKLLEWDAVI